MSKHSGYVRKTEKYLPTNIAAHRVPVDGFSTKWSVILVIEHSQKASRSPITPLSAPAR